MSKNSTVTILFFPVYVNDLREVRRSIGRDTIEDAVNYLNWRKRDVGTDLDQWIEEEITEVKRHDIP